MSDFVLSIQITALGMGLVFGSIVLLWLMMILLTRLTASRNAAAPLETEAGRPLEPDLRPQLAAVAVALALADREKSSAHPLAEPPTTLVSAWQLGMRTRQMSEKGNFRKYRNA
jgi:Na+-transporting methylmalonyl-CoA/oxaloacetate decarboxylase gamma subunit